jgi:hypothetical protein
MPTPEEQLILLEHDKAAIEVSKLIAELLEKHNINEATVVYAACGFLAAGIAATSHKPESDPITALTRGLAVLNNTAYRILVPNTPNTKDKGKTH